MSDNTMPSSGIIDHAAPAAPVTFAELGVPAAIARALADDGKTTAFPIQAETLPDSLSGRDVLGRGATGSGKTLAYAIPLVARIGHRATAKHPVGLVLAPTRELANQINDVIAPLARACGLTTTTVYGGVPQRRQSDALRRGADIVVACPGRLEDLIEQRIVSLDDVEVTVLDEADEMADMGFLPAVTRLLAMTDPDGQRLLFSATLDHGVDALVRRFLTDPKVHDIDSATAQVSTMTQHIFQVTPSDKPGVIEALASGLGKRILFTRTKRQAEELASTLVSRGIPAVGLHGDLSQGQRARSMKAFRSGEVRVMVATDVAARGMDVSDVELVAQIDPPADPKSFLHRSGRTARAGQSGDVVTLVTPRQKRGACQMMRRAGIHGTVVRVGVDSAVLGDLVGDIAPRVEGWTLPRSSSSSGAGRKTARRTGRGYAHGSERRNGRDRGYDRGYDHERSYDHDYDRDAEHAGGYRKRDETGKRRSDRYDGRRSGQYRRYGSGDARSHDAEGYRGRDRRDGRNGRDADRSPIQAGEHRSDRYRRRDADGYNGNSHNGGHGGNHGGRGYRGERNRADHGHGAPRRRTAVRQY